MWWRKKKKSIVNVGQKWVDRHWGDTVIIITAVSPDGIEAKYTFSKVDGTEYCGNYTATNKIETILNGYKLCQDT